MSAVPSPSARLLSDDAYRRIDREVAKYPADQRQSAVMSALAIAQAEQGYCSRAVIDDVAAVLGMPPVAVWEVATFYGMYETSPVGRIKLSVCTNLPCALSGGDEAAAHLKKKLGIGFRETTADGKYTLLEGECMGACGDAPVLIVNNQRMCSFMSNDRIDQLLAEDAASAQESEFKP
ncbi:NADH-quinone oxidoreductase subunit NuoE [soil metagenome]